MAKLFRDPTVHGEATVLLQPVDIAPPGHRIAVSWNGAAGATSVEITSARLTIYPAVAEEVHSNANVTASGAGWIVDVPQHRRVRALSLNGFKQPGGDELTGALPDGMRIAVAFPPVQGSGFDAPRFAVPAVNPRGSVPHTLTGATFNNRVLQMTPATAARNVRLALVTGDHPTEFVEQPTELDRVHLTTHAVARNAKVTGPDGATLWEMPEFDPNADAADVDLPQALEIALRGNLQRGEPLEAECRVVADAPAQAIVVFRLARGALVHAEEGIIQTTLAGDPVSLAMSGALADETPESVVGDLTIRYEGIRILESASDSLPATGGPSGGMIVGAQPAIRTFPPAAFSRYQPARIGVYGRAPATCELAFEFVEIGGDTIGSTLSAPAVLSIDPDGALKTRWVELPADLHLDRPAGLRVRANSGRFFWVTRPDGQPLVRVAVRDPDPGGRPVFLGSSKLADVTQIESQQQAHSFPVAVFIREAPQFRSDLFLTIDCGDVTLRYPR